jgi:hypothetical protein
MPQQLGWLPQLLVTAIPGLVNVWLSSSEQRKDFQRRFPIFRPQKSFNWWLLQLLQFLVPAVLFWWVVPQAFRIEPPTIDRKLDILLIGNAFAFGWGFVALINAPISVLSAGMLETGTIYSKAVNGFISSIVAEQKPRMRRFRSDLEAELANTPHFNNKGFNDLCECVGISYTCLSQSEADLKAELQANQITLVRKIKAIKEKSIQAEKSEEIVKLLRTEEVLSIQDWPELIRAFGGRDAFINQHFKPRSFAKSRKK